MAYEVILRTGTRTPESIRQQAIAEHWAAMTDEEIQRRVAVGKAFDGIRAVVAGELTGKEYFICYIHPEDKEKAKEGYYLVEQAPFFGSYINNRKQFNIDWAAGEYEPDYNIRILQSEAEITAYAGCDWSEKELDKEDWTESGIE